MQQRDLLLPWRTVWDNVLLAPELHSRAERMRREPEAKVLLEAFRLDRFAHALPAQLSGGMRQRVALMRTLLCHQDILLLDEPFGALDAITRGALQAHLLQVWRDFGKTVLLVTHDVDEALRLATRVLLFSAAPGRVLEEIPITTSHRERSDSPEILALKRRILARLEVHDA
jgi:ABC-type nitrate/sulfonate/bicarbonate transport system ATPase subunit